MDVNEIISKNEAITLNQTWFYTGVECSNGHLDKRYVKTGICYACKRLQNKRCNKNNPDTFKKRCSRNYKKHKIVIKIRNQKWAEENREKSNAIKKNWHINNIDCVRKKRREFQREQRKDPFKRISKNVSKAIWQCLKGTKGGKTWLSFVQFTIEELISHLESKFKEGMTWENYGKYWHIDHIKPLSWFNLEIEFKDAWCLKNLQPLEASLNLSKNNKYEG